MSEDFTGFKLNVETDAVGRVISEIAMFSGGIRQSVYRQVLDAREKQVRDALIRLGWTPPQEVQS